MVINLIMKIDDSFYNGESPLVILKQVYKYPG